MAPAFLAKIEIYESLTAKSITDVCRRSKFRFSGELTSRIFESDPTINIGKDTFVLSPRYLAPLIEIYARRSPLLILDMPRRRGSAEKLTVPRLIRAGGRISIKNIWMRLENIKCHFARDSLIVNYLAVRFIIP